MKPIFFITGTDTGVGKTLLTALLTRFLRARGIRAVALKPLCSGGRDDALALHAAMDGTLPLDEINPWYFSAPIAPLLAARQENQRVKPASVLTHIRRQQKKSDVLLVEGAGGLLSPMGEKFNARDLMAALRAIPIIVAPNQLGAVNHILLTLDALPQNLRAKARVVFMTTRRPDTAAKTNPALLAEFFDAERIFILPWLGKNFLARPTSSTDAAAR